MNDRPPSILVVEDERVVALDLRLSLERLGYRVTAAVATAAEAVATAAADRPDIAVVDVRLQDGDDGAALAAHLRASHGIPIIFITGYADEGTVSRGRKAEPFAYLVKPVRPEDLHSSVEVVLARHALETALRDRERWFAATLRAIDDAVIAVDPRGTITFLNPAAERMVGAAPGAAVGAPFDAVVHLVDEQSRARLAHFADAADRVTLSAAVVAPAGEVPVEASQAEIVDDSGVRQGAVLVLRDISERRALHQRIALADRISALGTLAAGVAHEINNPLTAIVGTVDLIGHRLDDVRRVDPAALQRPGLTDLAELVGEIAQAGERVARVVGDLRRYAQPHSEVDAAIDLRKALGWALRIVANEMRPRARLVTIFEAVPHVTGSEIRLGQVFVNLLVNAIHAIPDGAPEANEIRVRTYVSEDGNAIVSIRDSGSGVPPEVLPRIFEPFFTTKPAGSSAGLGLSTAHAIVRSLGGAITAESVVGQGSVFRVCLPATTLRTTATPGAMPALPPRSRRGRLLIVDDEPLVLRSIKLTVGRQYDVAFASSARQAMALLRDGPDFDLILCDVLMPEVSGVDLYREVEAAWPELAPRFLFITGGAFTPAATAFLARVPNPQLTKPFSPRELDEAIQRHLATVGAAERP